MTRLLLVAAVLLGVAAFAQPVGDDFAGWSPPQLTKPDARSVLAVCEALDQSVRTADFEAGAELLDFPVQLISDGPAATPTGATLDRAHWIGLVEGAIDAVTRYNLKLEARHEVSFVSDALAAVTVNHTASMRGSSKQWRSVYLLVRKNGAWKLKGLGGRGWGALASPEPIVGARRSQLPAGVELFNKRCATCHGKDGKGDTIVGAELRIPDLTDPKLQARLSDEQVLKQILEGSIDQETGKGRMVSYRDKYPEADLKALVPVVRSLQRKPFQKQ